MCGRWLRPAAHVQATFKRREVTRTMKVYQISYDLRKQRNYEALYERIRSYGIYSHALESTWLIASNQTAVQVCDYLYEVMDSDDGLLVTRLQGEAAWNGLRDKTTEWLQNQLNSCTV